MDLARGTAFNKHIRLPKGTPVDLTLDTSLNFDDLMAAYSRDEPFRRGSAARPMMTPCKENTPMKLIVLAGASALALLAGACAPTIKVGGADQYLRQARRRRAGASGQVKSRP